MRVLVTGGAGYIGSTAVAQLLSQGYEVNVLDDCSTGHADAVPVEATFVKGSILDGAQISKALAGCEAVMHFAAKSLVGESVEKPDLYRQVNVNGTRMLLNRMEIAGVKKIVFSSSASVYGEPEVTPTPESAGGIPTNPYGQSKLAVDEMLTTQAEEDGFASASLRYFNVAGAFKSESGWLAERHDPETHLIPNVLRATQSHPLQVFGTDWPTPDGTCVRDYVHVVDLIDAHIAALKSLGEGRHSIYNLGSGSGYSVREVITAAEKVVGRQLPTFNVARRLGDPAVLVADIAKAKSELKWSPTRGIDAMVTDTFAALNQ